ncbi:MAG: hypothetical protein JRJ87_15045 [Deltaproteobacteria bacterium]|nr:hypothetical protein [Deltaproteobacteria bacterium]
MRNLFICLLLVSSCSGCDNKNVQVVEANLRFRRINTDKVPAPRFDHSMITDWNEGKIYLFGGRNGKEFFNDLWVLDVKKHKWSRIDSPSAPPARSGHSLVFDSNQKRLILFGGFSHNKFGESKYHRDMWIFSKAAGWSREFFSEGPSRRAWHATTLMGDAMLIFGGFAGSPNYFLNDIWSVDLQSLEFKRIATDGGPKMHGRAALLAFEKDENLVVLGRDGLEKPTEVKRWSLQVKSDKWNTLPITKIVDVDFKNAFANRRELSFLVIKGPEDPDDDDWLIWTISYSSTGWIWTLDELESGPFPVQGMCCTPDPGNQRSWVCFGGVYRDKIGGETWVLTACLGPECES